MAILQPLRLAIKPAQPLAAAIGRAAWDGRAPIGKAKAVNGADAVVLLRGKTNMGNLIALLTGRKSRGPACRPTRRDGSCIAAHWHGPARPAVVNQRHRYCDCALRPPQHPQQHQRWHPAPHSGRCCAATRLLHSARPRWLRRPMRRRHRRGLRQTHRGAAHGRRACVGAGLTHGTPVAFVAVTVLQGFGLRPGRGMLTTQAQADCEKAAGGIQ